MARINVAEIRYLVGSTRSGALRWHIDGRRCRASDYLLEFRASGGPILSRFGEDGLASDRATSGIGLLPRGRAIHALARAIERQNADDTIDLTRPDDAGVAGPGTTETEATETEADPSEIEIDVREVSPQPEERPGPSPRLPSSHSGPSALDRASGRASDRRRTN